MEPLQVLLRRQDGVLTVAQAREVLGESALRWKVASGVWQQPVRGVLVAHSGPLSENQQLWVALLRAGPGAVLAGLTAAKLDGLRGYEPRRPQVLVVWPRRPEACSFLDLRSTRLLPDSDIAANRSLVRTRLPRSIVDAASWAATDDDARAILAAGVQQRLVRAADVIEVARRLSRVRRRKLILGTLADVADGAHSILEVDFARLCRRYGLPPPTRQTFRRDRYGRTRWLDVVWEQYGLIVEIDGLWHMEARAWWADLDRQNSLLEGGEVVLRYPAHMIREQAAAVAAQLRRMLRARGWND